MIAGTGFGKGWHVPVYLPVRCRTFATSAETPLWSLNAAVGSFLVPGRRASHDWPELPPLSRSRLSALAALRVLPQMKELSSAGQLPVILLVLGSARRIRSHGELERITEFS